MNKTRKKTWGLSLHLDLYDCHPQYVKNTVIMKKFIKEICRLIEMNRFRSAQIYRFGKGKIEGYSLFQWIETSSIVIHFEENYGSQVMMDLFSCQKFDIKKAVEYTAYFFKGKIGNKWTHQRGHR